VEREHAHSTTGPTAASVHAAIAACGVREDEVQGADHAATREEAARVAALWRRSGWQAWADRPRPCFRDGHWVWRATVTIAWPMDASA
jgi:hypothetical protein